jgi:hypothetical protein
MKADTTLVEVIAEKIEKFGSLSIELEKLKLIRKFSNVAAFIAFKLLVGLLLFLFFLFANISLALWLGTLLGNSYYGFLVISAFYFLSLLVAILLCKNTFQHYIISSISNFLKQ